MGNEHSKNNELTQNGKIPEKHKSGSVNGLSANITLNGLDIEVNGETIVQQNGGTHSLKLTESSECDYVVIESKCQQADAPVISEILETTIQKEEVKKSKEEKVNVFDKMFKKKAGPPAHVNNVKEKETSGEDQTDVSLPATDPQPESSSSGDEAAATNVAEHGEGSDNLRRKAETSTQTDRKTEADISTQTGFDGDDDDTTTNTEGPVEEVIRMETAATEEDPLNESAVVITEEAADETTHQEPFENQTPGMIIKEVTITENNEYEDTVFRAEQVEVSDTFDVNPIKNCDPEDESVNETEPEAAAESESNTNKDIIEGQAAEEENNIEQGVDVAAVCEHTDVVAADIPEPSVEEVFAGVELIETAEPKSNAVTPEAEETNGVPSPDEEPVISVMETISEVVCEEPDSIVATQGMSAEELSVPLVTEILVKVEPALEEDTAADAVAVTEAPGKSVEFITLEAPFNELTTIEELPEDAFSSPEDEVSLDSIPEVITSDASAQVTEEMIADVAPETVAEENNVEEAVPLEISSSLPKVVAECVEAVLAAVSEPTDFAATNTSEPSVEEVITEDISGATDMSADEELIETAEHESNAVTPEQTVPLEISASLLKVVPDCVEVDVPAVCEHTDVAAADIPEPSVEEVFPGVELIETAEPKSNAVTPEAEETNGIPSQEEEPVTTVMETISEVVCEEPNPILANQGMSAEELSVPLKVESAHKGVTADNAVAVNDVSGISEEYITVEAPSTIKELPEDTLNSPDVEVKSASIPEVITTDESPEVAEDVIADVGPETVEEAEPSPVIIKDDAEVIPEAAIDALSQEFDLSSIIPHEATMDSDIALEEEVISATTFVPLSGEREVNFTIPEEPSKRAAKDMNEEAIEALSNQLEAVPESAEEDAIVQEPSTRGQATRDTSSEEPVEENTEMIADTSVTSTDMEALLVRLQSACTSTVEESVFRFEGIKVSSVGYSITVTIHVAPKEEQQ